MKKQKTYKYITAALLSVLMLMPYCMAVPEEGDVSDYTSDASSDMPEESSEESSEESIEASSEEPSDESSSEESSEEVSEDVSEPEGNKLHVTIMNPRPGNYTLDGYVDVIETAGGYIYEFEGETATVTVRYITDGPSSLWGAYVDDEFFESYDNKTVTFTAHRDCVVKLNVVGYDVVNGEAVFKGSEESGLYLFVNGSRFAQRYIKGYEAEVIAVLPKGMTAEKAEIVFSDGSESVIVYFDGNKCVFPAIYSDFTVNVTVSGFAQSSVDISWGGEGAVETAADVVKKGSVVVFSVKPADGYYAEYATLNGSRVPLTDGQYTAIASEDLSFYVCFAVRPESKHVTLAVDARASGGNIAFRNHDGLTADIPFEEKCEIVFIPDEGYVLDRVYINGISTTAVKDSITVTADRDYEIIAAFKKATYKITAVTSKNYGGRLEAVGYTIIDGMVSVDHGGSVTFRFIPDMGHVISSVKVDGAIVPGEAAAEYTFTDVTSNHTLSVSFVAEGENTRFYTVSVDCGGHGKAEPGNLLNVDEGDDIIISFIPDDGYMVDKVYYDGEPATLTQGKLVLIGITADHIIQVTFREKPQDVTDVIKSTDIDWSPDEVVIDVSQRYKVDRSVFDTMAALGKSKRYVFSNGLFDITLQGGAVMKADGDFINLDYDTIISPESTEVFLQCLGENNIKNYTVITIASAYPTGSAMSISLGQEFSAKTVDIYTFDGSVFRKEKSGVVADLHGKATFPIFDGRTMVIAIDDSAPINHIVRVNCGANGTSDPMTDQAVADGGGITVRIFPFDGYMVDSVAVDGVFLELDEAARMNGACELPLSNIKKDTQVDIRFVIMPVEEKSQTGLIFLVIIISVAIVGGGALFFVQWRRTKY